MSDGKGCKCAARCEADCVCGVDWTPSRQLAFKREIADLLCALRIIAGEQQPLDNLMSNVAVARQALRNYRKRKET